MKKIRKADLFRYTFVALMFLITIALSMVLLGEARKSEERVKSMQRENTEQMILKAGKEAQED